jgi:hypothetical protein
MIIKTSWFTLMTLLSVAVFAPSTGFAQHGPGRHGPAGPYKGPAYDTSSEAIFKGTVADVKTGGQETQLLLKTDTGTVVIHLGPAAFLTQKAIRNGDTLEVTGSRVTIGEAQVVLAREIRKGDYTWTLRDATGQPLLESSGTEARGGGFGKKLLLAGLIAKVVVLAVVLAR